MKATRFISKLINASLIVSLLFVTGDFVSCSSSAAEPEIVSFSFLKSDNSFLASDIKGVIDEENHIISVYVPSSLYGDASYRNALKCSIGLTEETAVAGNGTFDFNKSPVAVTVYSTSNAQSITYSVVIGKALDSIANGDLMFSEYYMGNDYVYKGAVNQCIEITNKSSSVIDLSAVKLNRQVYSDGERCPAKDKSVTLEGYLKAGKSLVLYSSRWDFDASKITADTTYVSDAHYNGILTVDGQDTFTLTSGGNVIDSLGYEKDCTSLKTWGYLRHYQRKPFVTSYSSWNMDEWVISSVTNAVSDVKSTLGTSTATPTVDDKSAVVTYFAVGDDTFTEGTVSGKTITVNIPSYKSLQQTICIGTTGDHVIVYDTKEKVISGKTKIDFSKYSASSPLKLLVYNREGNRSTYTVTYTHIGYTKLYELPSSSEDVVIYYPAGNLAMSTTPSTGISIKNVGDNLDYKSGMAAFKMEKQEDGTYCFYNSEKGYLKSSSLGWTSTKDSDAKWTIKEAGDGLFYLVGSSGTYLEYYNGFKFYKYQASYASEYKLELYKKD